jgi:beta-galactosidase
VRKGKLNFSTAPQCVESFDISYKRLKFKEDVDYYIRFSAVTRKAERLIPAGHEVASAQFPISLRENVTLPKMKKGNELAIDENSNSIVIRNKRLEMVYDKSLCILVSLKVDGKERFADGWGIRPNFWRAPTDNDYGNGMFRKNAIWKEASNNFKASANASMEGEDAILKIIYSLPAGNSFEMEYRINCNAVIHVSTRFNAVESNPDDTSPLFVPRLGVRFRIDSSNDGFSYFGRGPAENYIDRKEGSLIGLYKSSAKDEYVRYVRPQECGHHCDVRRIEFADMSILADEYMEFNALRNSVEDFNLGKQKHVNDITSNIRDYVEVCLDWRQMGVGGYDSWGSLPDDYAMIPAGENYEWGFTIIFP